VVINFLRRRAAFQTDEAVVYIAGVQIQGVTHQPAVLIDNFYIQSISLGIKGFPGKFFVAPILGANQAHTKRPF